jgi:hypothetical protein
MAENIPLNKRLYQREKVELIAQYFIVDKSVKYLGCTVINLSRAGAGALFPRKEKISEGAFVLLDVIAPTTFERLSVVGEIRRIQKRSDAIYAGIQFAKILSDEAFKALCDHQATLAW